MLIWRKGNSGIKKVIRAATPGFSSWFDIDLGFYLFSFVSSIDIEEGESGTYLL